MKRNVIFRIIFFSLAIVILSGLLLAGIAARYVFVKDTGNTQYTPPAADEATRYDISQIKEIEVNWVSGSIEIACSAAVDQIIVSETNVDDEDDKMICRQSGNKLVIDYCRKKHNFGFTGPLSKELVITVPQEWLCNAIEIETASSDIRINDLKVHDLDIVSASGKCDILNCDIGEFDISTASGDIFFDGSLRNLELNAASANCKFLVDDSPASMEFEMASGDLELVLPDDQGFTCKMNTASGNFSTDFGVSSHNSTHRHGDGSCKINIEAISGDVSILKHSTHHSHHN